jgi:hypothetical protein
MTSRLNLFWHPFPIAGSHIRKNAIQFQANPNARISCALCMLFDLERCRRLDVRFGTPAD